MSGRVGGAVAVAALALGALGACTDSNPVDAIKTQIETRPIAQGIVDAAEAQRLVQFYQAKHGENPPSIEALEASEGKLKRPPAGKAYRYDPATGTIELVDVPR